MHTASYIHSTTDGDDLVAFMARVSNPSNQSNKHTAPKLINYLIKHNHWSPFEMVSMCVQIETTRSVAAQILRHRSFSFQEFSQRYAEASLPSIPNLRRQDFNNRQNSIDDLNPTEVGYFQLQIEQLNSQAFYLYKQMLKAGVAKECARDVLPLSTPTTLYMHGTLRSWYHFISLRTDVSTQKEHRLVATACKDLIAKYFPQCYVAMFDHEVRSN